MPTKPASAGFFVSLILHTLEQLRSGALHGCRHLKLACGLREFPPEIFSLADTLEILDLSGNALSALPDDLPRLARLRIIFCSDNQFAELPEVLGRCPRLEMIGFKANQINVVSGQALPPALRWLILTDNRIAELPPEIGDCVFLQKLMLAGNALRALPSRMAACRRLELLRLSANQLPGLPAWLLALPRLSWLAYAGNPFCAGFAPLDAPLICAIPWSALRPSIKLGEGASGVIHQAEWLEGDQRLAVAVKRFKGAMTSDGLPHHEMQACIHAGEHAHLIPLLGRVDDHPEQVEALVMALVDPAFVTLAAPPSLESCTRDIYSAELQFPLVAAIRLAHGIASAARHLHAQGIMHGDLYAHNILHAGDGRALLGDFGAASFFSRTDPALARALQGIEVRAFGCLLEELLERSIVAVDPSNHHELLSELQQRCVQENVMDRPAFSEIERSLRQCM